MSVTRVFHFNLQKLVNLYERTIRVLAKMPPQAAYRVNTHAIVQDRLQHVKKVCQESTSINAACRVNTYVLQF